MAFEFHLVEDDIAALPLLPLPKNVFKKWLSEQSEVTKAWIEANGFAAEAGTICALPDESGKMSRILFGWDKSDFWGFAALPHKLPAGTYRLEPTLPAAQADAAALSWTLANYHFTHFKPGPSAAKAKLVWPEGADRDMVLRLAEGICLARDMVNQPANAMGPAELAETACEIAGRFGATCTVLVGDALLSENYPAIHAVGRAASRAPRLIDLRWGEETAPKVTIVGKGVCFDSGGLDLKSSANMKIMKKDMGGAAVALGLAQTIMAASLKVRLRLLIPAVENAVSGDAFRPLDVLKTRKGLTVEIGNTDAEGRLILCDALAEADSEKPDLLLDLATLTGAARTALGPDLPALFTPHDALANAILACGEKADDPLWRMPLWAPYRKMLDSKVADINNASDSPHAGAITAALFLMEFVAPATQWAHIDLFAWNPSSRPGRPEGGEAMTLRALFFFIRQRYASS